MSWISKSQTEYPSGSINLGVVFRSVAIASWIDHRIRPDNRAGHYVATLDTQEQVRIFCEQTIRIPRSYVPDESKAIDPSYFCTTLCVKATGECLTDRIPCDPVKMFGSLEIASLITKSVKKTSYYNQHVQDGGSVNLHE